MFLLTDLVSLFPKLPSEGYLRTSPPTVGYNCVAWAAGDDTQRWDVDDLGLGSYWPQGVPKVWTIISFKAAFATLGFEECANGDLEVGFDKVVIYVNGVKPTHAARQLPDGKWTSKLGDLDDVTHTLEGLRGTSYGEPQVFLRKPAT